MSERSESARRLRALFEAGLARVRAGECLPPALDGLAPAAGRTWVLGYGKAAAAMARAARRVLTGSIAGAVVTPYGYAGAPPGGGIEAREAGHPVPDEASLAAAERMLTLARAAKAEDRILFLASGGGSACLAAPQPPLELAQKQAVIRHLVLSGAAIGAINTARKHLSAVKGGRLALAAGTRNLQTLVVSDVTGDDPATVASGPSLPDATTRAEAGQVLDSWNAPYRAAWESLLADPAGETPKPGDIPETARVIAAGRHALEAAAEKARGEGLTVHNLGDRVTGEARDIGAAQARQALALKEQGGSHLLLSGGELTVSLGESGERGGPNLEYLAGLMLTLEAAPGIAALAADTDGYDGAGGHAGGFLTPDSLERARALGLDPQALLAGNASYDLFAGLEDLLITGPTETNVNDFRAVLVEG